MKPSEREKYLYNGYRGDRGIRRIYSVEVTIEQLEQLGSARSRYGRRTSRGKRVQYLLDYGPCDADDDVGSANGRVAFFRDFHPNRLETAAGS